MKELGIRAKQRKIFKATTDSMHKYPVADNLLNREFNVCNPNQAWVSDITYVYTKEGWLYLSTIMDLYSRKIVGWAIEKRLRIWWLKLCRWPYQAAGLVLAY